MEPQKTSESHIKSVPLQSFKPNSVICYLSDPEQVVQPL